MTLPELIRWARRVSQEAPPADKPAKPEGDCALDEYAKLFHMDASPDGGEEGCGETWEAWEIWCDFQYASSELADFQECMEVEEAWNQANGAGFTNDT